ncbi:MAG: SufS family cysteine desulfurase [Gemmatimonadales bacterium]|nr:SufS family cysteine desulfurase [Gemmatimonadales bacterium]MDZ4391308.1 SufS family cysteine desulfurase [Gemmatimonadales bacterium]
MPGIREPSSTIQDPPHLDALRAEFPILSRSSRGKPLIYLDSGATTQKPAVVIAAEQEFYAGWNANIHRGVYEFSERATMAYDGTRDTVARFLGGVRDDEIVFVRGTTEAVNLVAQSFLRPRLKSSATVLVSEMEHHANIVPWQLAGAKLVPIPVTDAGELDLDAAGRLLATGPALLAVVHVSNTLGTVNPIAELAAMARQHGVPVLVDGAQAVGHFPVDLTTLGVDFYCFSGHKLFGPTGTGVLWARREHLESMPPYQGGGDMIDRVSFERTTFAAAPHKFEAGTPDIAGVIGMAAAIRWIESHDRAAWEAHDRTLLAAGRELLEGIPGVKLLARPAHSVGVLTFTMTGAHPHDIASILDSEGICIRAGHHCTQPLHARFGVPATARASFGPYTSLGELNALVLGLHKVREIFG